MPDSDSKHHDPLPRRFLLLREWEVADDSDLKHPNQLLQRYLCLRKREAAYVRFEPIIAVIKDKNLDLFESLGAIGIANELMNGKNGEKGEKALIDDERVSIVTDVTKAIGMKELTYPDREEFKGPILARLLVLYEWVTYAKEMKAGTADADPDLGWRGPFPWREESRVDDPCPVEVKPDKA